MPTIDEAFLKVYSKRSGSRATVETQTNAAQPTAGTGGLASRAPSGVIQRHDAPHQGAPAPTARRVPANAYMPPDAVPAPAANTPYFEPIHVEVVNFPTTGSVDFPSVITDQGESIMYERMIQQLEARAAPPTRPSASAAPVAPVAHATAVTSAPPAVKPPLFDTPPRRDLPPLPAAKPPAQPPQARPQPQVAPAAVTRPTIERGKSPAQLPPTRESTIPSSASMPPIDAKQAQETAPKFQPVWEVDSFGWPATVTKLEQRAGKTLSDAGRALRRANADGLRVIAVTSPARGHGRTTVAMQLAREAAKTGLRVVLVDGDTECPVVADRLAVEVGRGWIDAAGDGLPLEEVAVYSISDNMTLLPLVPWNGGARPPRETSRVMRDALSQLAQDHDLVIVDATQIGALGALFPDANEPVVDAVLLVCDQRRTSEEELHAGVARLQRWGIDHIGIVENFVEPSPTAGAK